jgi:hypothetical protein
MYAYLSLNLAKIYNNPKLGHATTIAKILKRRRDTIDIELSDGKIVTGVSRYRATVIPKHRLNNIYTKEQRLEIYRKALKRACADPAVDYGLCALFFDLPLHVKISCAAYNESIRTEYLPEFQLQTPTERWSKMVLYWYPLTHKGWEKRIQILLNCIEMVKTAKF